MKLEGSINGINIQKTGVKVTFMLDGAKEYAMEILSKFVDKPVTLELLIDSKRVMENYDKISDDQRKKIYALIKEFSNEYGDTEEETKAMLKEACHVAKNTPINLSLSTCSKEDANLLIEFALELAKEQGYDVGREHTEKDTVYNQCVRAIKAKECIVCHKTGLVMKDSKGRICLCDEHAKEASEDKNAFMNKYHLVLV